jgi:hypothetical protein
VIRSPASCHPTLVAGAGLGHALLDLLLFGPGCACQLGPKRLPGPIVTQRHVGHATERPSMTYVETRRRNGRTTSTGAREKRFATFLCRPGAGEAGSSTTAAGSVGAESRRPARTVPACRPTRARSRTRAGRGRHPPPPVRSSSPRARMPLPDRSMDLSSPTAKSCSARAHVIARCPLADGSPSPNAHACWRRRTAAPSKSAGVVAPRSPAGFSGAKNPLRHDPCCLPLSKAEAPSSFLCGHEVGVTSYRFLSFFIFLKEEEKVPSQSSTPFFFSLFRVFSTFPSPPSARMQL